MTTARNQLYCSTVNKKYGVPCSYIAKHPEVTKRKMKKQRKSDSPYYVLWKNRYDSIRKNKSLSKYSANVSAKAKELINYYFNLANCVLFHDNISSAEDIFSNLYTIEEYVDKYPQVYFACKALNYRSTKGKWDGDRPLSVYVDWFVNDEKLDCNLGKR